MQLIFERGDRDRPVGHALIYFQGGDGSILASYISVPPFTFDVSKYVPPMLAGAFQGMDLSDSMILTPIPPIAEEVPNREYLHAIADRRQDDLVYAGGTMRDDPMRLGAETAEAAREYAELYQSSAPSVAEAAPVSTADRDAMRYADMTERERLDQLTSLTGRLRQSLESGGPDEAVVREIEAVASALPAKYRADRLVTAARTPGDRAQRTAELYLERSYKLLNEEYLDLDRIDREIEALSE